MVKMDFYDTPVICSWKMTELVIIVLIIFVSYIYFEKFMKAIKGNQSSITWLGVIN